MNARCVPVLRVCARVAAACSRSVRPGEGREVEALIIETMRAIPTTVPTSATCREGTCGERVGGRTLRAWVWLF